MGPPRGWIFQCFSTWPQATSCLNMPRQADLWQCYQATSDAVLISVHWEKKSQVLSSIRKIIAFTNQHESGPLNPGLKWVANMAWPWLMRRFFNLTRCFISLLQCRFGFGFPVEGIWSQEFCLPRAPTWCAPIVSLMPEPVSFFFLSEWREDCGLFVPFCEPWIFKVSKDEESNSITQQACEYSLMLCAGVLHWASSAMGSAIWLEDVCIGLSQLAFKKMLCLHLTLVLLMYQVPAYRGCWFVGKLGPNTSYWLSAQNRVSLFYQLSLCCGAFLAKSLDGNRSEAQRV